MKLFKGLQRNAGKIMISLGLGCMAASIVEAVKATKKTVESAHENGDELSVNIDTVKKYGKNYAVGGAMFVAGSVLTVCGSRNMAKTIIKTTSDLNAAVALYNAVSQKHRRAIEKVEELSPEVAEKVKTEINKVNNIEELVHSQNQRYNAPINRKEDASKNSESVCLFVEPITNQSFYATPSDIRKACGNLCYEASHGHGYYEIELNSLLVELGLKPTDYNYLDAVFDCDRHGTFDISWTAELDEKGNPYCLLNYNMGLSINTHL